MLRHWSERHHRELAISKNLIGRHVTLAKVAPFGKFEWLECLTIERNDSESKVRELWPCCFGLGCRVYVASRIADGSSAAGYGFPNPILD